MPQDSPYRWPCGGPQTFTGVCNSHSTGPDVFDIFVNIATVPNPAGGSPIAPYERWTPDLSGPGSCESHNCDTSPGAAPCEAWIGVDDNQYNPTSPTPPNTFSKSGTVDFSVCHKYGFKNVHAMRSWHGSFGWNSESAACETNICPDSSGYESYRPTADQTKYLIVTYSTGFANTFFDGASRVGTMTGARTVNAISGETTSTLTSTETDTCKGIDGMIRTILSTTGGAGFTGHCDDDTRITFAKGLSTLLDGFFEFHCIRLRVRIDAVDDIPSIVAEWNGGFYAGGDGTGGINPFVPSTGLPLMTDPDNYSASDTGTINAGLNHYTAALSWSRTATTVTWDFTLTDDIDDPVNLNSYHFYGTVTLSNPNTAAEVKTDLVWLLSHWPLNNEALYPYRTDAKVGVAPLVTRLELQNASPIGFNTFTVDDMTLPINDSMGNVPFSMGWTPTYTQRAWFDPQIYRWKYPTGQSSATSAASALIKMFDGSIQGAPLPEGFQNFFDYYFLDFTGCCFNDGAGTQDWDMYQLGWGMNAAAFNSKSGAQIPLNATQWTNFSQARNLPDGAFLFYADKFANYYANACPPSGDQIALADNGGLFACKFAVILDVWNSENFGRPGGADKFSFDETQVYCAANASGSGAGSTWNITDADTNVPPDSTLFDGIWGGPVVGGFYSGNTYTGGVLTLGTLVYHVPSDWTSAASGLDTGTCIGKLRFPTFPSLLGRIGVIPSGTTYTFATPQTSFAMNVAGTETVDLFDAAMTPIASSVTATRATDSTFTAASHSTARWAMISGAPAYYFNDSDPKGDYLELEWVSDFRTIGEVTRLTGAVDCSSNPLAQPSANAGGGPVNNTFTSFTVTPACLKYNPCAPKVVCISPNGETFANGTTYDFPETFICDERYGSKWWGWVQATMTDVFWQTPHRPCGFVDPDAGDTLEWLMDDGTCQADSDPVDPDTLAVTHIRYYAHAPQVEPRQTIPCNYGNLHNICAPNLPGGVDIGWLSPVLFSVGNVAYPPQPAVIVDDAVPQSVSTAYQFHKALCATIAGGGCRFNYSLPSC